PPDDFLTRSIFTLDPQVPYTDERRPPPLGEEPTAALRRYLNPTTRALMEQPRPLAVATPADRPRPYTASIQMQTYKVHRAHPSSSSSAPASRFPRPYPYPAQMLPASQSGPASPDQRSPAPAEDGPPPFPPGPRQREMRENPDFI